MVKQGNEWPEPKVLPDQIPDTKTAVDSIHLVADNLHRQDPRFKDEPSFLLAEIIQDIFGDDCWDDSVGDTAKRVVKFWKEYVPTEQPYFDFTVFPAVANQLIIVRDIEFSSLCAHHLLPFYGKVHVGYVPNELMVGLSKIPRLVDFWAHRPSTQEALTARIASDLKHKLAAMGVAVVIESRHTCMACRGVRKHNGAMITSEMRGIFLTSGEARREFLELIGRETI